MSPEVLCPDPVTGLTAEPGSNQVRLVWAPSPAREATDDAPGSAEAEWFVVVVRQGETSRLVRVEAPATGTVITGLRNGVEASFEVYAVTDDGSSEPAGPVAATPLTGMEGEVAGLIVAFEPGVEVSEGQSAVPGEGRIDAVDLTVAGQVTDEAMLVQLSDSVTLSEAEDVASQLAADPAVKWAEPDQFIFTASTEQQGPRADPVSVPNDARYATDQWNLWDEFGIGIGDSSTAMTDAWAQGSGEGTTVAVIDTGITAHPDLDSQVVAGYDFVSNPEQLAASRVERGPPVAFDADADNPGAFGDAGWDANPTDPGDWRGVAPTRDSTWHGTKVAGVIAAQAHNSEGIAGIAPGAKIQPIRALSWRGGLLSDIAASITWASGGSVDGAPANETPADVINLSLAAETTCPTSLQQAIDSARERGSVIIAAAGNANDDASRYAPGNCNGVITVSATDRNGVRAPYSNFGERIDISAPGGSSATDGGILTTSNTGTTDASEPTWAADQGTSYAAAHVTAAAAILKARDAALTPDDIAQQLTGSVRSFAGESCDADPTRDCGPGILSLAQVATISSGDQDYAMAFTNGGTDATQTYAQSTSTDFLNSISGAYTIEAWVRPRECSGEESVVFKQFSFILSCASNVWQYYSNNSTSSWNGVWTNTGIAYQANQWQHVAVTRGSASSPILFYFNGQLAHTRSATDWALPQTNFPLMVGARRDNGTFESSYGFSGQIDEVRFYSTNRSDVDGVNKIPDDMHNYGPTNTTGLVAYYDFNEGPAGTTGTGTVYNRASGAESATNLRTVNGPTYTDVKQTTTSGADTVVTFPRSYLTAAGGWRPPSGASTATVLAVGGGGGGGAWVGGGGGGGGVIESNNVDLTSPGAVRVIVGAGGRGARYVVNRDDLFQASFPGGTTSFGSVTASGGGEGASLNRQSAGDGANGGGGGSTGGRGATGGKDGGAGGSWSSGGFTLYAGGGGGGAGQPGSAVLDSERAGDGGSGLESNLTKERYGGGGGGGTPNDTVSAGTGGIGGGGNGGSNIDGADGVAGRGGGGGGGGGHSNTRTSTGGWGGSGVVVVSFTSAPAGVCSPTTTTYTSGSTRYRVLAFKATGSCTWDVPSGVTSVDYLVVAGGGGGGNGGVGGGGGAGGMLEGQANLDPAETLSVQVGAGGSAATSGQPSGISGDGLANAIEAFGGGFGGVCTNRGGDGGSGGGGCPGGRGTVGQGNDGWGGGGGAGGPAGASPLTYKDGGVGRAATMLTTAAATELGVGVINGSSVLFAGGGGLSYESGGPGSGGAGGGGNGGNSGQPGVAGVANTGGGGGGGSSGASGGVGGSGVVVLRYEITSSTACSPETYSYTSGGTPYTVVEFQGAGTCSWTPPTGVTRVDVLAVGGGGGGGAWVGGGGGGGGVTPLSGVSVTPGTGIPVTVGAGGSGAIRGTSTFTDGTSGGTSSFAASSPVSALGGGVGASNVNQMAGTGADVATGGGGAYTTGGSQPNYAGGTGTGTGSSLAGGSAATDGQPHAVGGGAGAGGNGSSGTGSGSSSVSGSGGIGAPSTITGASVYYGGGGGGSAHGDWGSTSDTLSYSITPGSGGLGGGGVGGQVVTAAASSAVVGGSGTDGLGGGGGGSANYWVSGTTYTSTGGDGGDGVVIVRYTSAPGAPTSVTGTASAVTTATVSWTAPSHAGASEISGYSVAVSTDGVTFAPVAAGTCADDAPTSTSTSCTVTDLTPGSDYEFKVRAINSDGSGAQSDPSEAMTAYGALDHFAVTATNGNALGAQVAGASFNVKITAQDSTNTTVGNFTGTVDLTSTSLFSAGSGTTGAFTAGVLASHAVTLVRAGATQTLTATYTGNTETGTSAAFAIDAATATKLQVLLPGETAAPGTASGKTGSPTAVTAGSPVTVTVNAVDDYWNINASATPTVAITSSDGTATLPANAALVSGTQAFSVTLKTAGTQTVTATDQAGSGPLSPATSAAVTVSAASPNKLAIATQPVAGVSGSVLTTQPVVHILDQYGNLTNSSATVTVTASGGGVLGGAEAAAGKGATSGVATFTNLTFAGRTTSTYTLTFASGALATAVSGSITPTAVGPASAIAIDAGDGQTGTMGDAVAIDPSILVTDSGGNPIQGVSVTFTPIPVGAPTTLLGPGTGSAAGDRAVRLSTFGVQKFTAGSSGCITSAESTMNNASATGYTVNVYNDVAGSVGTLIGQLTQTSSGSTSVTYTGQVSMESGTTYWVGVRGSTVDALSNLNLTTANAVTSWQWAGTGNLAITTDGGSSWTVSSPGSFPQISLRGVSSACGTPATVSTNSSGIATYSPWILSTTVGTNELQAASGTLSGSPVTFTATGTSRSITITADNDTLSFGTTPSPAFTLTGALGGSDAITGVTYTYAGTGSTTYGPSTTAPTAVGTYSITPSAAVFSPGSAANYTISYQPGQLTINKASQSTLTVTSTSGTFGATVALTTSGGSGTGAVTYAVTTAGSAGCSLSGSTLSATAAGTCTVTATKETDANYEAVSSAATTVTFAQRQITIDADDDAIVFGSSVTQGYTITSGNLAAGDAISGVTYTYTGTGSTSYGPLSTAPVNAGTYSVTPSAAVFSPGSSSNYDITYTNGDVTIGQASQSITFNAISAVTYGDAPFSLTASANSGLTITYSSSDTSVCSVSGSVLTIVGAGTCTITAAQAGNTNYTAASSVTQILTVNQAAQAPLSMTSASTAIYGQTIDLAASGGSGPGALSFGVTGGTCSISGTTLTLGNAGSLCKVRAIKQSSTNYLLAQSAEQTITIAQAGQTLAFTSVVPSTPLPNQTYTPAATAISSMTGLSSGVTPTFTVSGGCTLSGGVVTFTATGTCTVAADAVATTNFTVAAQVTQEIEVGALNQNITFTQPASRAFGSSSFALGATASSGLTVTYALGAGSTNSACSVSSLGVVTILAVGTCEAVASQTGDSQYSAASQVTRAFQVVPALATAPTLTSASASSQAITVGFAAPGFTGGVSITAYRLVATPTSSGTTVTSSDCSASPCTISGLVNGTEYTVTVAAINSAGTGPASSATTPLTPATAAFAVLDLAAVPGDTVVDVSWSQPADLGGGTFTRYDLYYRVAGSGAYGSAIAINPTTPGDITTAPTSYRVTGLANGTSYDFKVVTITSANGSEIPGNTAEVVQYPSTAPSAPVDPTVLAATATDVQFSWSAPLSDGGSALTTPYYAVTVTSTSPGAATPVTCTFASAGDRFCTAANLTNGAVYTFAVAAINRMGTGTLASTTYSVPSSDATLSALEVMGSAGVVALTPAFAAATTSYTASVVNSVASVTVTPTATMPASTITVDGVTVASGTATASIPLAVGVTAIVVEVTASDPRFSETYTLQITRLPAPPAGGGGAGGVTVGIPVMPPSQVASGSAVGMVMLGGSEEPDVVWSRTALNSGWLATAGAFSLQVEALTQSGSPSPLGPNGAMQAVQGGRLVIDGADYLAQSEVAVFAIPVGGLRAKLRSTPAAVFLGSTTVNGSGSFSVTVGIPMTMNVGDYVLQVNGVSPSELLRSVNMQLEVDPAPVAKSGQVREAAFYRGGSAEMTKEGRAKLGSLVAAVPAGATDVKVTVVGVSTSQDTPRANLRLARDRAQGIVDQLQAEGVKGTYTVSVSTTFDIRTGDKSADASVPFDQPMTSSTGKPLTTVTISYTVPPTT